MKKLEFSEKQVKRIKKTLSKDKAQNDTVASGELKSELARVLNEYMYINGKTLSVAFLKKSNVTKVTVTVQTNGFKPVIVAIN